MSLRERFDTEEWPPTDVVGNEFSVDWFEEEELNEKNYLTDSNGRDYSPFTGALTPVKGRCNEPLTNWRERYPTIRYCSRITPKHLDREVCGVHKSRQYMNRTAEEYLQTGVFSQTIDHRFSNLGPYQKLFGFGLFESLMGDSSYEFAPEHSEWELDFSDHAVPPEDADEDGILTVDVAFPTDYGDRGVALLCAALDSVSMMEIQAQRLPSNDETGAGALEVQTTEAAQLTSPTDVDPTQDFKTIKSYAEHHLNLPYSRLAKDRQRLLEYGGVSTETSEDVKQSQSPDELVLEVSAAGSADDPAPNATDEDPITQQVVDEAGGGDLDLEGTTEYPEAESLAPSNKDDNNV